MAFSNPLQNNPDAAALRKGAGAYLKGLREKAEITQQELARKVGLDYYTMVSQVEGGKTRLPPERLGQWAEALGVEPKEFATRLLSYYDPYTFAVLFAGEKRRK